VIELDERHQMAYSGLAGLNKVVQLKLTSKSGASYSITYIDESGCQRVIHEVLDDSCYPTQDFAVKDVHVIVDVGANIGIAAGYFRVNYPEAEIYCFEPDPFAFLLLQENARKLRKCHAFPFGLYSSDVTSHFISGGKFGAQFRASKSLGQAGDHS
ncbi:MAG: FkbM family methyltransferase, partial [Gloeomargarita sp. GMQP_bins_14]